MCEVGQQKSRGEAARVVAGRQLAVERTGKTRLIERVDALRISLRRARASRSTDSPCPETSASANRVT